MRYQPRPFSKCVTNGWQRIPGFAFQLEYSMPEGSLILNGSLSRKFLSKKLTFEEEFVVSLKLI